MIKKLKALLSAQATERGLVHNANTIAPSSYDLAEGLKFDWLTVSSGLERPNPVCFIDKHHLYPRHYQINSTRVDQSFIMYYKPAKHVQYLRIA